MPRGELVVQSRSFSACFNIHYADLFFGEVSRSKGLKVPYSVDLGGWQRRRGKGQERAYHNDLPSNWTNCHPARGPPSKCLVLPIPITPPPLGCRSYLTTFDKPWRSFSNGGLATMYMRQWTPRSSCLPLESKREREREIFRDREMPRRTAAVTMKV